MSWLNFINRLLPFATPGTPLAQDLIHLAAICGLLYFAPQIQEHFSNNARRREHEQRAARNSNSEEHQADDNEGQNGLDDGPADDIDDQPNEEEALNNAEDADGDPDPAAHPDRVEDGDGQAGPARAPEMPPQRNVGAKKAKSLARRDQRRAYHEFQRSQGEAQRARDAEGAAEREAAVEAERERRKAMEAALEAKKAKERDAKREMERRERDEEIRRRDFVVSVVRAELEERRMCDLFKVAAQVGGDVDEEWVERILRASGMLRKRDGVLTMVTGMGWVVRVSDEDMAEAYRVAVEQGGDEQGHVSYDELGGTLETVLRTQVVR